MRVEMYELYTHASLCQRIFADNTLSVAAMLLNSKAVFRRKYIA
jgi:hypothetical protein